MSFYLVALHNPPQIGVEESVTSILLRKIQEETLLWLE